MARTLLGALAGQGGRERLHGVPPASRGAHRPSPAAGGQRRCGRWKRPCEFPSMLPLLSSPFSHFFLPSLLFLKSYVL
jgi:hypothetical protein